MDIGVAAGMGTVIFPVIAEVGANHTPILFTPGLHGIATVSVTTETAEYHTYLTAWKPEPLLPVLRWHRYPGGV